MARLRRSLLPDGLFHATARAVFAQPLFRDDEDRLLFLELLAATVERYHWRCHAYCLMGNHYHLVLECARKDLSAGMQWFNGMYAQRMNERHGRYGHLFAARFGARAIQSEEQLEATLAYVLHNPVAAGLCTDPEQYRWSALEGPQRRKTARWTNTRSTARLARAWQPTSSSSMAPASTT